MFTLLSLSCFSSSLLLPRLPKLFEVLIRALVFWLRRFYPFSVLVTLPVLPSFRKRECFPDFTKRWSKFSPKQFWNCLRHKERNLSVPFNSSCYFSIFQFLPFPSEGPFAQTKRSSNSNTPGIPKADPISISFEGTPDKGGGGRKGETFGKLKTLFFLFCIFFTTPGTSYISETTALGSKDMPRCNGMQFKSDLLETAKAQSLAPNGRIEEQCFE